MADSSQPPDSPAPKQGRKLPPAAQKELDDRMSDPNYIRTQEYKKRVYERFSPTKEMTTRENVVLLPDGSAQATGPTQDANKKDVSALAAAKTIRPEDFLELHRQPCVRDSQLPAIAGGALVGGARKIFGATTWKASNWAVGTWVLVGFGMYEYCHINMRREKDGVQRAVEIMREKAEQKREQAKQARVQRLQEEAERKRLAEEQQKKWWGLGRFKFW